jgi:hypothetical protein
MKEKTDSFIDYISDSITVGANGGFGELIMNMTTTLESIISQGQSVAIAAFIIDLRLYADDAFCIRPWITACSVGNISDQANLSNRKIRAMINDMTTDEFSFEFLSEYITARLSPGAAPAGSELRIEKRLEVPQHILQKLAQSLNQERMQDLHIGFSGISSPGTVLPIFASYEIKYREKPSNIRNIL